MQTAPKKFIFITSIFCSLLFIGISIPLTMDAIEPNDYYGIRIDQAFQSEEMWYEINRYGGWALIIASGIMLVANIGLYIFRKKLNNFQYVLSFMAIFLACILVATFITITYAETLNGL